VDSLNKVHVYYTVCSAMVGSSKSCESLPPMSAVLCRSLLILISSVTYPACEFVVLDNAIYFFQCVSLCYNYIPSGEKDTGNCCLPNSSGVTHSYHLTGQFSKKNVTYRFAVNFGICTPLYLLDGATNEMCVK
jgi:hypothetical protein